MTEWTIEETGTPEDLIALVQRVGVGTPEETAVIVSRLRSAKDQLGQGNFKDYNGLHLKASAKLNNGLTFDPKPVKLVQGSVTFPGKGKGT